MRVVCLDIGERRIGVAISDATGTLARPLGTLAREGSDADAIARVAEEIDRLGREEDGVSQIVIGLPRRLDGRATEQTPRVETFARLLAARTSIPIAFQDERLTSREAERRLAISERDWRERKRRLDAAAAAVILQDYLDRIRD